jgi:hypothetical protein
MVLNGTAADTQIHSDILAGIASEDPFHDLTLTLRQVFHAIDRELARSRQIL